VVSHSGSDGSSPFDRMTRYGTATGIQAENTLYVRDDAMEIILDLFVDDSIIGRGHRHNMWSDNFGVTSVAHCHHSNFNSMTVINYAGSFDMNSYGERKLTDLLCEVDNTCFQLPENTP
jgi:uncharacterized protein YkwD